MNRILRLLLILGAAGPLPVVALEPLSESARPLPTGQAGIGRLLPDVRAVDMDGREWGLGETAKGAAATVVAFTSPTCPLSAKLLPTLRAIEQAHAGKRVAFVFVDPTASDRPEAIAASRRAHELGGTWIHDRELKVAAALGATSTTEVFVADASRTLTYRGAVDDQYGLGYATDAPRNEWLREALAATLAGRRPEVSATTAPGCALELPRVTAAQATPVTWHGRVSRILQTHCQDCHREGGIAPFPLVTMEDAASHAGMIRKAVTKGLMPPWFAAPVAGGGHSPFMNDRSLPEQDKADLLAWLDGGRPEGDPAMAPQPRQWSDTEWAIGKPDTIFQIPRSVDIKATGKMPYVHQIVDTGLEEDRWVQRLEVLPGARAQVHHVLIFVLPAGGARERGRVGDQDNFFAAYVPGSSVLSYPDGYAKKLPKGARLLFQLHYTPTGTPTSDRTRLGVQWAAGPPRHEVMVAAAKNRRFAIPPGAAAHEEKGVLPVPFEAQVLAFMPHMHVRGKAFRYDLVSGDGSRRTLLDVPRYDFNWQLLYRLAEPLAAPAGSRIEVTAVFDNSSGNPANPDPTKTVRWGDQTDEEMLIGYLEYVNPANNPAAAATNAASGSSGEDKAPLRLTGKALGVLGLRLDADKDGRISRKEAGIAFAGLHSRLDTDGDGFVTIDETRAALRRRQDSAP